jgi:hypothetical protein
LRIDSYEAFARASRRSRTQLPAITAQVAASKQQARSGVSLPRDRRVVAAVFAAHG